MILEDKKINTSLNFKAFQLKSEQLEKIHTFFTSLAINLEKPSITIPLVTMASEILRYCISSNYKYVFDAYVIQSLGISDETSEMKNDLYNSEMDTHNAKNFISLAKENNHPVIFEISLEKPFLNIKVSHSGKIDIDSINQIKHTHHTIKKLINESEIHKLNTDKKLMDYCHSGIELMLLTMKGIGIPEQNFEATLTQNRTLYTIKIPLEIFESRHDIIVNNEIDIQNNQMSKIFNQLQYSIIEFDLYGNIKRISGELLYLLEIPEEKKKSLPSLLQDKFYEDIFWGPFGIKNMERFENYRISIPHFTNHFSTLFNISGTLDDGKILTFWQVVNVNRGEHQELRQGSVFEDVNMMRIVSPYIPVMILDKARECIRKGMHSLPVESKVATIFFSDLISFTQSSEHLDNQAVIDLLNLALSNIVSSIERYGGYIDKFIGDGLMSIFMDPLAAVAAGVEIQNNLLNLNQFRSMSGEPTINARIGLNTGKVILGSIGMKSRMDWTALGDVVNTASRIEKNSRKNSVLIGSSTYSLVKDNVTYSEIINTGFKGKEGLHTLYFIDSVNIMHDGAIRHIKLLTEEDLDF